ncbi:CaiB/BaiF CoA transferase family protein [Kocuria sp. LHG3120]|jgi:crotonobetainyl-CoA:carnitine CoA-transferase CaiB-like acyl-CoA transferase|uniref:CaiB/BaiF CoA transferase family protein n=1 Tax=Kocuria sp. LHG3120 TaxID=2804590 RepID=UPI003CF68E2F
MTATKNGASARFETLSEDLLDATGTGPLTGLVVADFSRVLAGPYCTMLLADMGATVIKVEGPAGDDTRAWMPPVRDGESTYYLSINRNKRSIALDFNDPDDLQVAQEIARRADVLVENFKPGGLTKYGLDYPAVTAGNPEVIYASITGFGTAGGASLPGYDLLVQAMSGLMSVTGGPDTSPFRSGVAVFDVMTGLHASIGILAALHDRNDSGKGQLVELNLMSSALSGMVNQTGGYLLSGTVPQRMGNDHPSLYPYEPFPTKDGDIVIAIGNDGQFRKLCNALQAGHLTDDPRFSAAPERSRNRAELRPLLQESFANRTAVEWFEILTAARIPCGPINDVRGGIEFAEQIGLEPVVTVGHGTEAVPGIRHPVAFSRTPAGYDLAPPALDGDREAILSWVRTPTVSLPADALRRS